MIQVQQSDGMERGEENHNQPGNSNGIVASGDNTLPLFPLAPSFFSLGGMIHRARRQAQQQLQAWEHSLRVQQQQPQVQQAHHQTHLIQQQPQVQQAPNPAYAANGMYKRVDNPGLTPNMNSNGEYRQPHAQVHHNAQQQQQAWEHSLRFQQQQPQAQQDHRQAYLIQQQQAQVQQAPHPTYAAANSMYNGVGNRGLTPNMRSNGVYRQPHAQAHHNAQQQQQASEHSLRVHQQPQAQQADRQAHLTQQQQAHVQQAPHPTYAANSMYNGVSNRGLTPNMNSNGGYTGMASASAPQLGQMNMQFAPNFSAQIPASEGGVNGHGNGLNLSHVATYGVNATMEGRTRVADRENVAERRQKRKIKNREAANRSHTQKRARIAELEAEITQLKKENDRLKKEIEQMAKRTDRTADSKSTVSPLQSYGKKK